MSAERRLRVAVAGSAGVGKTTLARQLGATLGLKVIQEEMRAHLERGGRRLEQLPAPEAAKVLHELWALRKRSEDTDEGFVADNCALDFAAYALHCGCADVMPEFIHEASMAARQYDAIFVLPWGDLPYVTDGVRGESHHAELRYQLILEGLLNRYGPPERVHFLPNSNVLGTDTVPIRSALSLSKGQCADSDPASTSSAQNGEPLSGSPITTRSALSESQSNTRSALSLSKGHCADSDRASTSSAQNGVAFSGSAVPLRSSQYAPSLESRTAYCLNALKSVKPRSRSSGFVSLVGAGPGDPDLLTVRAAELLSTADVVAYDALIPPAVLARIGPQAERILAGHRNQGAQQVGYRLHPAVLQKAAEGKHVVRLKQGDPFIFGRGGEEAEELLEAGVPFEVVSGVSAALGAAASAGIPLTHREFASDVSFATGHDIDGPCSKTNWKQLGAAGGTLVLYMATRRLDANLKRLIDAGRSAHTPAAYIAAATTPEQVVVTGTLGDLAQRVVEQNLIGPPALVIVGEVVALRARLAERSTTGPLAALPQ